MILRPFTISDAPVILSWIKDKTAFRKWSADRYSVYPPKPEDMQAQYAAENVFPFTALDDEGKVVGHIMLRYPDKVKTFEAGKVVEKEMTTLSSSWSRLNGSSDDYDKNRWLERMAATQRELEKCEVQFENTCNDAAEAINALSDEFGIEIAI